MKRELNPGIIAVAVVCVLAVAAFFLYRAGTEKPAYPGMNAGKPAAESPMGTPGAVVESKSPDEVKTSQEAARQGFSGATPGGNVPAAILQRK